jgi:hypothetical protein
MTDRNRSGDHGAPQGAYSDVDVRRETGVVGSGGTMRVLASVKGVDFNPVSVPVDVPIPFLDGITACVINGIVIHNASVTPQGNVSANLYSEMNAGGP